MLGNGIRYENNKSQLIMVKDNSDEDQLNQNIIIDIVTGEYQKSKLPLIIISTSKFYLDDQ